MSILINILLVLVVLISVIIVLLVLMQRPKNEGLGAAFGGGMTENLFGAQTTNVLQKLTRNLGIAFFVLCAALSWLYVKQTNTKSDIAKQLAAAPTPPPATPVPVPPEAGKVEPVEAASEAVKPEVPSEQKPATPPPAEGGEKKPDAPSTPPPPPAAPEGKPADAAPEKPAEPAPDAPKPQ
jgi:preprotein translocase subunit SecG